MYADKDRQREKTRERVRRYRALHKGVTVVDGPEGRYGGGVTPEFVDGMGKWAKLRGAAVAPTVIPKEVPAPKVEPKAKPVPDWRVAKERQMAEFLKKCSK